MKGKITHYNLCGRQHVNLFSRRFFRTYGNNAVIDPLLGPENLGRSWSGFVYRRDAKSWLVLFDSDDGSGGTPADCKLIWSNFQNVIERYKIDDYVIFKAQYANLEQQAQHYPFKWDVYPTGIMSDDPNVIHARSSSFKMSENPDIDVLFVGGRVHENNKPYCWPKNRNLNQWWVGNRKIGYEKLLAIKSARPDLNIVATDGLMPGSTYYDAVTRAKICIDFPGVGQSSRKFFEFVVLGKCVLSLLQQRTCWDLQPDVHYSSLGFDFDYNTLENKIDSLLKNNAWKSFETECNTIKHRLTHEWVSQYVVETLDNHIDKKTKDTSFHTTYP